jgi:uncharacterized protein YodC (DUF2158 family)
MGANGLLLTPPTQLWECPSCPTVHRTQGVLPPNAAPMHSCPGLKGFSAPFVPAGTKARHVAVEREDYVNGETVRVDAEGRPIMAIRTERADGSNDCHVYAPTAVRIKEAS